MPSAQRSDCPSRFAAISLARWVDDVADSIRDVKFDRVVLVAHSLGGVTVTQFAVHYPDLVAAIIYISAIVPADGGSMATELAGVRAETLFADDGGFWPDGEAAMANSLFNGDRVVARPVLRRLVPEPARPMAFTLEGIDWAPSSCDRSTIASGLSTALPTTYRAAGNRCNPWLEIWL